MNNLIQVSKQVRHALDNNMPVVALESTIISHGMPFPQNFNTALKVEQIIKDNGAVPATIAVVDGVPIVGINNEQIELIAKQGAAVKKISKKDIPITMSCKENGATTVAATMFLAHAVGIKVFVTGGIGGVHRGASTSMDISSDLEELASTDIAVVCAGAKSILDLSLTLECLETKGVFIIGYKTNQFPAFFTRESGFEVDCRLDSPEQIADVISIKSKLGIKNAALIVNPIPEQYSIDFNYMSSIINRACTEAADNNIKGKEVTPFLLDKINLLTNGESLNANIQLVYNNAKLGAEIALELSKVSRWKVGE